MIGHDILIGSCRPVVLTSLTAPFFTSVDAEPDGFIRCESAVDHSLCDCHGYADALSVIINCVEISVHVGEDKDRFLGTARDLSVEVVRGCILCHLGVRIERYLDGVFPGRLDGLLQSIAVFAADRQRRCIGRTAHILHADPRAVFILFDELSHRDRAKRTFCLCLICRIVDPPVFFLVDLIEHQFAVDIQILVIFFRSPVHVDQLHFLVVRLDRSLVSAEIDLLLFAIGVGECDVRAVECPSVDGGVIYCDILKTYVLHDALQVLTGLLFRRGTGASHSYSFIVAEGCNFRVDFFRKIKIDRICKSSIFFTELHGFCCLFFLGVAASASG